jgi:hypothetical protein
VNHLQHIEISKRHTCVGPCPLQIPTWRAGGAAAEKASAGMGGGTKRISTMLLGAGVQMMFNSHTLQGVESDNSNRSIRSFVKLAAKLCGKSSEGWGHLDILPCREASICRAPSPRSRVSSHESNSTLLVRCFDGDSITFPRTKVLI